MSRADRVIAFVETLTHTAGNAAGRPFVLRDWQKSFIRDVYDNTDATGRRLTRTALLSMPRKNGKSELVAALTLAHLCGPESEQNGQLYSAAADNEQSGIIFRTICQMIRQDDELPGELHIKEHAKTISCPENGSVFKAISSESRSKHGFNASFIVYDELAQAPNGELFDVLTTSVGARKEPLIWIISTQNNDPNHIMTEQVDYGLKVQSGDYDDDSFKSLIYAASDDADPWDESVWHDCNPALGDFRSLEEMRTFARKAQRLPSREATFRNLYLNQRVDAMAQFITRKLWEGCKLPISADDYNGMVCYGGLDLSSTQDLTAFTLAFPIDDEYHTFTWFWTPADRAREKEQSDKVPYPLWIEQGHLLTTPGRAIRYDHVAQKIAEICSRYDVKTIAADRWRLAQIEAACADSDTELPIEGFGQGYKDMGLAVDTLEREIENDNLRHDGNPVLQMCIANTRTESDPAGNRKFNKAKSRGRIDGTVTLAMALQVAVEKRAIEEPAGPSRWESDSDDELPVLL